VRTETKNLRNGFLSQRNHVFSLSNAPNNYEIIIGEKSLVSRGLSVTLLLGEQDKVGREKDKTIIIGRHLHYGR
jgi:hypothetical protein